MTFFLPAGGLGYDSDPFRPIQERLSLVYVHHVHAHSGAVSRHVLSAAYKITNKHLKMDKVGRIFRMRESQS